MYQFGVLKAPLLRDGQRGTSELASLLQYSVLRCCEDRGRHAPEEHSLTDGAHESRGDSEERCHTHLAYHDESLSVGGERHGVRRGEKGIE